VLQPGFENDYVARALRERGRLYFGLGPIVERPVASDVGVLAAFRGLADLLLSSTESGMGQIAARFVHFVDSRSRDPRTVYARASWHRATVRYLSGRMNGQR
jgi:hypothetical protein